MSVLVSVIIPTYNRKFDLEKALLSVLEQSYKNFEVLVCDDGSNDGTQELVAKYSELDSRVCWISSQGFHAGRPAIPRNRGIKEARGEWLAFLDSDDIWLPNKLEFQFQKALELKVEALCSNAFLDETSQRFFSSSSKSLTRFDLLHDNHIICSSVFIKKSLLDFGFPEEEKLKAFEDYACWLKVALKHDFYYEASPLLRYTTAHVTSIRKKNWQHNFLKKLYSHLEFSRYAYKVTGRFYFFPIIKETIINIKRAFGDWLRTL